MTHKPFYRRLLLFVFFSTTLVCLDGFAADFTGRVVGVTDGDTITVLHEGIEERVRLNGIDCPEKRQAHGNRAKQFTSMLVFGKDVTVTEHGLDMYGRTIGDVSLLDGTDLNRELIKAGLAWWYRKYSDDKSLGEIEAVARKAQKGLWASPSPVAPWDFRKARRGEIPEVFERGPPILGIAAESSATSYPILGNRKSRIYHRPDCPNYGEIAVHNQVPFANREEAEKAGYRIAKNCP
jgi:micrococcal nuclease